MARERNTGTKELAAAPTLEDVARKAGVSTATVSRCLNTPERVVDSTRRRVEKVINDLGYAPNFGARAMVSKRTNTIGAIIPTMENAIFARGLQAFQEELATHGLTLLVASSAYEPEVEESQVRALLARGADALLLIGFQRPQSTTRFLKKRAVPVVVAWAYRDDGEWPSIGFDNRIAMRELARKVIALGHRKIAVISAPQTQNDRASERVEGVLEAAAENSLDPSAIKVVETPYSVQNGRAAAEKLLQSDDRPTVLICGNDVLAVGAIAGAKSLGLSVPEDVSVTGFDDIEIAQIVKPALTTVHVPHRAMGREAARQIAGILTGKAAAAGSKLETQIVDRESLGAPPEK
ncbi:MAG: LacI family DNA-binding transcriptional regulator [Paracoccaceae bacterium]|nr:LacI family DNA-binding transcriptional regulator [Paracoccaceae bacterium]